MGLTVGSTGSKSIDTGLNIQRKHDSDLVIALGGNPNVGKSTVFNALTGMKQHTGNWPGKTVSNAQGSCSRQGQDYVLVDVPGFTGIRIHAGNDAKDTDGCLLLGENTQRGKVLNSRYWCARMQTFLQSAINRGEKITITIR